MPSTTFDASFQNKIVTMALRDSVFAQRCEGLILPGYFDNEAHSYLIDLNNRHFKKYRDCPDARIVMKEIRDAKSAKRLKDEFVDDLKPVLAMVFSPTADLSNRDFYVAEVSRFARQRAMEDALTASIDIMDTGGDFATIEAKVSAAQMVGAHESTASHDLFKSMDDRIAVRAARSSGTLLRGISSGYHQLDDLLYHKGWGRKELVILMGGAKAGKSMGLADFAINACKAGYKVLYTTHENSAEVTLDRMDAAISNTDMKVLESAGPSITAAMAPVEAMGGCLKVEEFPAGEATVNDIGKLIHRYAAEGVVFDMLVCDYADELKAEQHYEDERFKLKSVFTALRALCTRENLAGLTGTQTNRAGNKATTVTATDVGEDWSKMKIADLVLTISATPEEKKSGHMRLTLALCRNQAEGLTLHCVQDKAKMQFIKRITSTK